MRVNDDGRSDAELLAAGSSGDGAAVGVLVRRYIRAATLLAAQLMGDRDDADDVVQDAFTAALRNARTFDARRPFPPWFFAIVRRLSANRRARERRRARLMQVFGWNAIVKPPDDESVARLDAVAATRAMADLSPMQRACFELVVMRDLSTEEVAAMHGITESTVRQHVFRARAALRLVLERQPKPGE